MITKDSLIDGSQNVLFPILTVFAISSVVALWFAVNHKPISPHLLLLWLLVIVSMFIIRWLSKASSALASKLFIALLYLRSTCRLLGHCKPLASFLRDPAHLCRHADPFAPGDGAYPDNDRRLGIDVLRRLPRLSYRSLLRNRLGYRGCPGNRGPALHRFTLV